MKHLRLVTVLIGLTSGALLAAPPLPVSLTTPDHCFFGRTITLTGSASDPDENLDYLDFQVRLRHQTPPASWERIGTVDVAGGSAEGSVTWTPPGLGHYEFYLGVFDSAGESHAEQPEGQRYQYAYLKVESPQPVPKAVKLPASVVVNSTVTIAASAFDPDGNLKEMTFYYRFNDGPLTAINRNPIPVSGFYATARVDWTPAATGTYAIQASVEDYDGYWNDSSLGGAEYVVESVEVVRTGTSQGKGTGQSGNGVGGQSGGVVGQSGGSAPSIRGVSTPDKIYRNEYNSIDALVFDTDGDLDNVQFQYKFKATGTSQWGAWMDLGSAVEVSGIRDLARSSWKPTDGRDYGLRATVTDEAGNNATAEKTSFDMRQGSPLVLSFTKPNTVYHQEPNALSAYVKDATDNLDDVQFQYKGPSDTNWQNIGSAVEATSNHFFTARINWTPTETGSFQIKVIVTDTSENESPTYETTSFTVVSGEPVVVSVPTPSGVYSSESKTLSARAKDPSGNLKEVQFQYYGPSDTDWQDIGSAVSVSGGPGVEVPATKDWIPDETGSFKIKAIVWDQSNNTHSRESTSFTVASGEPVVVNVPTPSSVYNGESKTLSARVKDPSGNLKEVQFAYSKRNSDGTTWATPVNIGSAVPVSGGPGVEVPASKSWIPSSVGTFKIEATVKDQSNNTDSDESSGFPVVDRPRPPVVVSVTPPSPAYKNESHTVSAVVSDADGDLSEVVFEYRWNAPGSGWTGWINIGFLSVSGSRDTPSITWTPIWTGTYRIRVTVVDDTTSTSDGTGTSITFPVNSGSPVVVSVTPPSPAYKNENNTISAVVTDPSGNLRSVQFQYDGPSSGTSWVDISSVSVSGSRATPSINWRPNLTGTHQIRVAATDASGNTGARTSTSFTVECSPPVVSN